MVELTIMERMNKREYILISVLAVLCLFLACISTNYDYDFFARIIVGERVVEEGILPFKDFLSYTPTHPWFDHEWGSGVVFYLILKYLKPLGIVLFQALMMFGTAFFVIKTQKLQKNSYPISIVFMSVFCLFYYLLNSSLVRCQLFSFFFFSLFLFILEKYKKNSSNLILTIPVFIVLWNNLHGGVTAGLGLIFMYIIGAIIERRKSLKLISVLILSVFLLAVNPYGVKYLNFLFSAATMTRKHIIEWWPIWHKAHLHNYIIIVLPVIYGFVRTILKKNKDWTKIIVLSVTMFEGLLHVKLIPLALISVFALCYNDFIKLFGKLNLKIKLLEKPLCAAFIGLALIIPLFSPQYPRADFSKFPLSETEFLKLNNIKGNLLTQFGHGSYVAYKLYPNNLIFMDGRYEEVYNTKELNALRDFELAEENWRDIVNNYPTQILMTGKKLAIYKVIQKDKDWVQVYEGPKCGIFVKRTDYTNEQIGKFKPPSPDINYYKKNMFERIKV